MPEIDPVILQLRADVDQYQSSVAKAGVKVDRDLKKQEASAKKLEAQFRQSSGAIAAAMQKAAADIARSSANIERSAARQERAMSRLKRSASTQAVAAAAPSGGGFDASGLLATAAAGISAAKITAASDAYTRFTNQLKVAGLEGANLAQTQEQLFQVAQKGGVQLELLGRLYGGLANLQGQLNTTSADSLALTNAVSDAIKINGTSAEQASGAILGLNQSLSKIRVESDDYNQILDGARPLLLAAVQASDKYGGSLGKLKQDIEAGKVSGADLFRILQGGFPLLAEQAQKATLTIGQSFQVLDNALGKFIGTNAATKSAMDALSGAIQSLAANLDTIIPALATIATLIGGRYVAGLVAATASSVGLRIASIGLATSLNGVGAGAALAGRGLLAAFGGPVGLAVTALAGGMLLLSYNTESVAEATSRLGAAQATAAQGRQNAITLSQRYAKAIGAERAEIEKTIHAELALARVRQAAAKSELAQNVARLNAAKDTKARVSEKVAKGSSNVGNGGLGFQIGNSGALKQANTSLNDAATLTKAAADRLNAETETLNEITYSLQGRGPIESIFGGGGGAGTGKKDKTKKEKTGPDPEDIARKAAQSEAQYQSELEGLRAQRLAALSAMSGIADDEYNARIAQIDADEKSYARQVALDEGLTAAKRAALLQAKAMASEQERQVALQAFNTASLQQQAELDRVALEAESEFTRIALDMTTKREDRAYLEQRLLDIQYEQERAALDLVLATKDSATTEYKIAEARKAELDRLQKASSAQIARNNEGPLASYKRDIESVDLNDEFENIAVNGLQKMNDGLTDAILGAENLGDVFKNVAKQIIADLIRIAIQQIIVKTLMEAIGGGGGGGGFFSGLASAFGGGRASGGPVQSGKIYRVNETQREYFQPLSAGKVTPESSMKFAGSQSQPAIIQIAVQEGAMFDPIVRQISGDVSIQYIREAAPTIADAGANMAIQRSQRQKI